MQALCNKHRIEKGYYAITLRDASVGDKCDECDETKGVLVSDKWKVSPNGLAVSETN